LDYICLFFKHQLIPLFFVLFVPAQDRLQSHARVCVVGPSDSVQALQSAGDQWKVIEM
jgi:hypothetical protein